VLAVLFVVAERRAAEPIVPLELFRSVSVSAGVVVNLLGGAGRIASFFLVALYLQEALRYAPATAGLAMLPTSVAGFAVTVLLLPRALGRWGAARTVIIGLLLVGGAHLWLARGPVTGNYVIDVLPGLLLAAAGVALSFTPTTLVITSGLPAERAGIGSGMASASAQLGGALGIAAFSALQAAASTAEGTGYSAAFLGAAGSALLAAVLAIVLLLGRKALPARLRPAQRSSVAAS
jgi:Major Facilitator Superfamily